MLISELLELDVVRAGGPRVLVGAGDLDREVRWAHSGEIGDIAQYLSGGEVLLTAATGLTDDPHDQRRYIRELAEVNIAALIVELGRGFSAVPDAMLDEARARGLVLVELEHEVPFVGVTQAVGTALVNAHHEAVRRATDIGDAISQRVIDGASLPELLELAAERFANPVVLEDGARHVIAVGRASGPTAPILRAWQAHSRRGHRDDRSTGVKLADSEPPCAWSVIALRGDLWGRLHVLEMDSPLDDVTTMALGRVATSTALHLLTERDAYLSEAAEQSLIVELMHATSFSGENFAARASGLGLDFDGELVVLVAGSGGIGDETHADSALSEMREAMRAARWPSLVAVVEGQAIAVAAAHPPAGLPSSLEAMRSALHDAPSAGVIAHVGVSRPVRASLLPRALAEAQTAYQLGPTNARSGVHHYDDLVLHRLLSPLLSGPELANFVESELGSLLEHDERHSGRLLETLSAYLECNGRKAAAAQKLHIQRRSVYYRLERIEQLLGRSVDAPQQRARLYVALRAHELLGARAAQRALPRA